MELNYSDKTVVITGAGGAIGRAMAIAFAKEGAAVAVCDISEAKGGETAAMIEADGGKARFFHHDVTSKQSCEDVMARIAGWNGGIDVLINNAGVNVPPEKRAYIQDFDDGMWEWILRVDLDGVYLCSKAALRHFRPQGGAVLNISSVVGLVPLRNQCAFTAAKAGVINMSKAMAVELGERNIRVNVVAPGSIAMEGTSALIYNDPQKARDMLSHVALGRVGKPEEISGAALYLCSDAAAYVTGAVLTVDGGWSCGYARNF